MRKYFIGRGVIGQIVCQAKLVVLVNMQKSRRGGKTRVDSGGDVVLNTDIQVIQDIKLRSKMKVRARYCSLVWTVQLPLAAAIKYNKRDPNTKILPNTKGLGV
jgi:hypothetical protein